MAPPAATDAPPPPPGAGLGSGPSSPPAPNGDLHADVRPAARPRPTVSNLTRDPQPKVLQQKIVLLYDELFKDEHPDDDVETEKPEGFWREFFLLRPDPPSLEAKLEGLVPEELLELEPLTRQLFRRSVATLRSGNEAAIAHALETLAVFLTVVLGKRYTNPSSDIINVLAGLDYVDTIFTEFVGSLDAIIRTGSLELREKAIDVTLAVTSGAYQTSLFTYFIQRDLFPAIMKLIQDASSPAAAAKAFTLVGLLANYNKFESQNPYQVRLSDFVNEKAIRASIASVGQACQQLRAQYLEVKDDLPEGWTWANTLTLIGLGSEKKKPAYDEETAKTMFAQLPGEEAAILLATYDSIHANKVFCFHFVTIPASQPGGETPFASYTSLTSYILQHAHLSQRTTLYAHLCLMVFRLLIEDPALCKRMCSDESKTTVRLCRQRSPFLPLAKGERPLATSVMDAMVDGINHNLRRRLDVGMYTLCVGILLRIISYMSRTKTRLAYHWSDLFRSLLGLVRFLAQYAADLKDLPHIETLLDHVVNLLALGVSAGESFLPGPAAYDDLFYKVVEAGEAIERLRDAYRLGTRKSNSVDTLVSVGTHYRQRLADGTAAGKLPKSSGGAGAGAASLTSLQVLEVIKQGYDTLSIQAREGLDSWEGFREADERTLLKKMARAAVADVKKKAEASS